MQDGFTIEHIMQFANLWELLQSIQIYVNNTDSITWNLTNNGCYSSKLAYNMQFLGHTKSHLPSLKWRPQAPPNCEIIVSLIIQNRVWTSDRFEKRGQIAEGENYATNSKKLLHSFSFNFGSPFVYGQA
jgi:hypothetical protein